MRLKTSILIGIIASQMLVSFAFAICILGFGNTCEKQVITNTATNQLKVGDVKANTDSKSSASSTQVNTQQVNADIIKQFIGSQDANTLFVPLTNASTKQIENTNQIFKEFKQVLIEVNKSNQDLLKAQAEESRKFTEQLVKQVIGSPPTIPIVSGSSSFPIVYPTNSLTTPFYIQDIDSINNFNKLITNLPNMSIPLTSASKEATQKEITQTAHGFVVGNWVYLSGASTYALADSDLAATSISVGVVTTVTDANTFTLTTEGYASGLSGLTAGSRYYISGTAGAITATAPTANIKSVFIADTTTSGYVQQFEVGASSQALTYGRVNAAANLASISYSITSPGTALNFDSTVYSSGMTFSGTNGITPSVAGRYRASFLAMSGSGDMNGDGTFHIVQNGVSLGSIFIDIMQAAGVNQIAPFIDVDLAANLPVTLQYQPAIADSVPWVRGSYFQLTQLPTASATVVDGTTATNDQAATGYFDIGNMRMQWGTHADGNVDTTTVTLPAAFANTSYVVTVTNGGGNAISSSVEAKTTTTFDIDRATSAIANTWGWQAVGLKP